MSLAQPQKSKRLELRFARDVTFTEARPDDHRVMQRPVLLNNRVRVRGQRVFYADRVGAGACWPRDGAVDDDHRVRITNVAYSLYDRAKKRQPRYRVRHKIVVATLEWLT